MNVFQLLLLIYSATTISAECNKCEMFSTYGGETYHACVEYNAFKSCSNVDGERKAIGDLVYCRKGTVCSVQSVEHPCVPRYSKKQSCHPELWSDDFCQKEDNFIDPSDNTCQKYKKCVKQNETFAFRSENFTCVNDEQFSEELKKCVTSGVPGCPLIKDGILVSREAPTATTVETTSLTSPSTSTYPTITTSLPTISTSSTTSTTPSTSTSPTTVATTTTPQPSKNGTILCEKAGVFSLPSDTTCTAYVKCEFDEFLKSLYSSNETCQNGTQFNGTQCVDEQQAGCPLICKRNGFFKDPEDKTCSKYLECEYKETSQSFRIIEMVCPVFQHFNESEGECSRKQQENCPPIDWCSFSGKFPDPDDLTCRKYVRCMEDFESLYGIREECEGITQFDKKLQLCTNVQQEGCPPVMGIF